MTDTPWQGRFLAIRTEGRWEYVERARGLGAAVILAIDDGPSGDIQASHVILIEQFRVPLGRPCLELPAGLVGDDDPDESITVAAARELEEETGYRPRSVEALGTFASSPGLTSETFTIVRAGGLERVGDGGGSGDEDITVHRIALTDLADFVAGKRRAGVAIDAKLLLLLGAAMMS